MKKSILFCLGLLSLAPAWAGNDADKQPQLPPPAPSLTAAPALAAPTPAAPPPAAPPPSKVTNGGTDKTSSIQDSGMKTGCVGGYFGWVDGKRAFVNACTKQDTTSSTQDDKTRSLVESGPAVYDTLW